LRPDFKRGRRLILKYLYPEGFVAVAVTLIVFSTNPEPHSFIILGLILFLVVWILVMFATFAIIWKRITTRSGTPS